ncbi:MAG: hypothetical protein NTZ55_02790 [Candidatus Roizmanbacteria bacterium]|nr:hypothetical protein [Candidatus Roizmanbacteria bacterium]
MKNFLATAPVDTSGVIGKINSPVNDPLYTGDVNQGLGSLISTGIQLFFFVAGLATLLYMLWGAFDWITSNGEKEKLQKAQNKIQSAAIGLILVVVVLVVFNVIMGTVLGGKFGIGNGFTFSLPHI